MPPHCQPLPLPRFPRLQSSPAPAPAPRPRPRQDAAGAVRWTAFNSCDAALPAPRPPPGGWVLANAGRAGFFRVNYSEPLWDGLIAAAAAGARQIPKADLAGALDDAFALGLVRARALGGGGGRLCGPACRARPG
jgi:hypothetical protein